MKCKGIISQDGEERDMIVRILSQSLLGACNPPIHC